MMAQHATSQLEHNNHKIFLGIEVDSFDYGIPVECVREIVYQIKLNPLPKTPAFVRGVATIRDETIPVLDLNILLGGEQQTHIHDESSYVVIQLADSSQSLTHVCLLADQILQTYKLDIDDIDPPPSITGGKLINYILGVSRIDDHVLVLFEPADLISPYLNTVKPYVTYNDNAVLSDSNVEEERKNKNRYLSIFVNGEEFAFPLPAIFQVINVSSITAHVDDELPDFICKAGLYSDQIVVIVPLAEIISGEKSTDTSNYNNSRDVVILVQLKEGLVGIVVNHIGQSYESETEPQKNSVCSDLQRERVHSLGFIQKSEKSIEIINPFEIFSDKELSALNVWMKNVSQIMKVSNIEQKDTDAGDDKENSHARYAGSYLVTQVGDHLIGLDNRYVDEVLSYRTLLPLRNGPHWFPGVLDLRNNTYPVINLHTKFGLDHADVDGDERNVLVMIRNNEHKIGLMVNKVMHSAIISASELSGTEQSAIYITPEALNAVATTSEGLVHIIDLVNVIEMPEVSANIRLQELKQGSEAPEF